MSWRASLNLSKRELAAAALLMLPPLMLIPLGAVWLWQQGHGLWFFALCLLAAIPASLVLLRWRRSAEPALLTEDAKPEPDWPERERHAFETVRLMAEKAEPLSLADTDKAIRLAERTIRAVAQHYRPDAANPLAHFTMPEALLLVHQISGRLRRLVLEMVPLADRLTVAQLIQAQETVEKAMPLVELGQDLYSLYRLVRPVVNPAGAALGEARRFIFDAAWDKGKARLQRRLTQLLVIEAGRAAIELYSGRLKRDAVELDRLAGERAEEGAGTAADVPALRVIVAGQTNAGKSSLVNALAQDIVAHVTPLPGPPAFRAFEAADAEGRRMVFVDAPGIEDPKHDVDGLVAEALKADIVLWVIAAHQPARALDQDAIRAYRDWFARHPELNRPPLIAVVTHIDELSPFAEWDPPYDIALSDRPKASAIRRAIEAIAAALALDPGALVPVSLAPGRAPYNLDALRARIAASLPEARQAQLARAHAAPIETDWRRELARLVAAGRLLLGA